MFSLMNLIQALIQPVVQEDMIALLEDAQWALLPSREILEKIKVLFSDNHTKGTYNLTAFTEVFLPFSRYPYSNAFI